ncbi:ATP synthase regulation protein NCA2-domain-containing protein [Podospora didyma]|uniref:ATP synthase regulation protein NCA2-domain-containing protein n=1 Tax=Podospora didyma TaxID=330526 RepID=A0AAE0U4A4_9PEZI|nr:ATP synthase regulation protein NCA2-domain-containing protein [Podospora didyma]
MYHCLGMSTHTQLIPWNSLLTLVFVASSKLRRLSVQVDLVSVVHQPAPEEFEAEDLRHDGGPAALAASSALSSLRVNELLHIVKSLSSSSASGQSLPAERIVGLLSQAGLTDVQHVPVNQVQAKAQAESDIEWLLVSKATVQTYGILMNTFLDQIIPLSDDTWYWDEVLGSYSHSALFTLQTSPLRMWSWSQEVYHESLSRFRRLNQRLTTRQSASDGEAESEQSQSNIPDATPVGRSLSTQWRQFYGIVKESVAERSMLDMRRKMFSRVDICRSEARKKRDKLRRLREMTATGLGMMMDEGLDFTSSLEEGADDQEWKGVLERSVVLMDMILRNILVPDLGLSEFEDKVFTGVEEDPELAAQADFFAAYERPAVIGRRLVEILSTALPDHINAMSRLARKNGRPSKMVRYWPAAVVLLVSSSTVLRILVNRRDDIINWIQDLGTTTRDFWLNWVVEPVRKIIGTIRHDTNSEIALMSRDSLKADRDSLERMVVEFSRDNPSIAVGTPTITDNQIADIRSKVREGDVTPVLRAFEKDLRQPFVGAIRGDLVRSLLIQVQKTKVDLEVAISGIDALLKSQELVFGFVGLTPGILVSIGVFQYLRSVFGSRRGIQQGHKARRSVRVLRKIDRILSEARPATNNLISYKDHGLLICEVHVLRRLARSVLPGDIEKEFIEDLDELAYLKGIPVQMRALDRIRWAYAEWLSRMR